jgi:hypothetical protein
MEFFFDLFLDAGVNTPSERIKHFNHKKRN